MRPPPSQRVVPEQVYMNFSSCSPPPICPVWGRAWGEVRHDPCVQWLGNWKEVSERAQIFAALRSETPLARL